MRHISLLLMLAISSGMWAQEAEQTGEQPVLEEITVTAMRREQSLQDVSATVTAFTGDQLVALRVEEVSDVAMFIPNVDIKSALGGQNSVITIRGVGLNDFSSNNTGSVGVYVDDVFLASVLSLEFNTFDLERIEVLKGPQGTLYGRNATAGAINIRSRLPSQERESYFKFGVGNYEYLEGEGAVGGPIGDRFAFRLSVRAARQGESYFVNPETGDDFGDRKAGGIRGQLGYFGDKWETNLKLQVSSDESAGTPYFMVGAMTPESSVIAGIVAEELGFPELAPLLATDPAVGLGGIGQFCDAVVNGNLDPESCADLTGYQNLSGDLRSGTSNFAGGNLADIDSSEFTFSAYRDIGDSSRFTSITGYRKVERTFGEDVDSQSHTLLEYQHNNEVEQWSQEFRFNVDSDRANWVAGLFFSKDEIDVQNEVFADELFLTQMLITVDQETTSWAAFADVTFDVTDSVSLIGGLRYTSEEKDYAGGTRDLNPWGISLLLLDPDTGEFYPDALQLTWTDTELDETDWSGRIGIEFRPSETTMLYGTISKGFKSGGIIGDITFSQEELEPFEPEILWSYEAGLKMDPLANLRFNASIFYYDYENVQTFVQGSLGPVMGNVEEAEIKGADVELVWLVTEGLNLQAGLGFLDSELGEPYEGNKLPNAPDFSGTLLASYEWLLANSSAMVVAADLKYSDDIERNAENDPLTTTDSYTLVNGRISWISADGSFDVTLWGKNLFDEDFTQQAYFLPTLGNVIQAWNPPRTYGVSLTKHF